MTDARERLGEVTVPSGTLTILDPGHIGLFVAEEIPSVPVLSIEGLPRDRPLPVVGVRVAESEWAGAWDHVAVRIAGDDAQVASTDEIGEAEVDFARLMVADAGCAERWVHEDSLDGLADYVFWGRDAPALAEAVGAPSLGDDEYGWRSLPIDEVVEKGSAAEAVKEARGLVLATDYRPHSHHWQALEQVRASPTESGVVDVDGLKVCLFMTSWGDGTFPVFVDRAADGSIVQIRIQLHTEESEEAMAEVHQA